MKIIAFQLLDQVHQTFYDAYELSQALKGPPSPVTKKGKRRPSVVDEDAPLYDVKVKHLSPLAMIFALTGQMHNNVLMPPFVP